MTVQKNGKKMKKSLKKMYLSFAGVLCLLGIFVGFSACTNLLEERSDSEGSGAFGSISVNGSERAVFADDISYAVATVTGTGIESGSAPSGKSDISGGKGTLSVSGIPAGKNRIVTVQAYSSSNGKINGVTMRAICDIEAGKNTSVSVNWSSTALGNIFAQLLASGKDSSAVSSADIAKIKAAIPADVSAPLVNASKIASDYVSGGASGLKSSSEYRLSGATVALTTKNISGYKVYVGDPFSKVQEISAESSCGTLIVPPGTWPIYVVDSIGAVKGFGYGTFTDGGEHTVTITNDGSVKIAFDRVVIDDKIVVHAKVPYIYIWNSGTSVDKKEFTSMKDEDSDGWYDYTIGATSANMIFLSAANWDSKESDDLSRTAGEWWFKDGKWYEGNPEDSVAPIIISFKSDASGTASGTVTLSAEVTDNSALKKVVFYIGEKEIGSSEVTGTSATATCEWNTAYVKNATYTVRAIAYDTANNASEEKTLSITTKNENLPPVAVISGSSYAKLDSTKEFDAEKSYDQNGGTIKSYSWSVSGGATISSGSGTSKITVKMPSSAGEVTISLSVTDDEGASSETVEKTVKVREQTQTSGDFRDETIYFLMTTRFYDGDKSNNEYCWDEGGEYLAFGEDDCGWRGDFKGLAEKLDYIKALGFSAIWITPVVENASGIDYHGYHAYDFSKVDPRYESTNFTYADLIDECHKKGIKVIQDIVLNHSGNFGEKNLFHMFDKETVPYVNKDVPTPAGGKRSPFMKLAKDGNAYQKLMAGLAMAGSSDYDTAIGGTQYTARINAMKEDTIDTDLIYHHTKQIDWNSENCQLGQMAGDCVDLNTENPVVFNYLKECYVNYINMGVDAFRIDTVKHISRLTFNKEFIPAFMEAGGENFYIFGETCARYRGRWNEGVPALSPSFYTWKENQEFAWNSIGSTEESNTNSASATAHFTKYKSDFSHPAWADGIANHLLKGNEYHTPDYSMRSRLDQIDFPMHWAFANANDAFSTAVNTNDPDFNDATWNVVYVDSHDYAPDNAPESQRYAKTEEWPRNLNLMFTFRGIPCIYYGSEIEFMAGAPIDPANTRTSLDKSGRAYFGDFLEGSITADDFGVYTASGTVEETLNHNLAQHIIRLNQIRRAIPALRKGQYSTEGCEGSIAFKRRYTDNSIDSFALVAIGGQATFKGVPSGEYVEVITGKTVNSSGTITTDSIERGNMRVYVLKTDSCEVDGKIGKDGAYLK